MRSAAGDGVMRGRRKSDSDRDPVVKTRSGRRGGRRGVRAAERCVDDPNPLF